MNVYVLPKKYFDAGTDLSIRKEAHNSAITYYTKASQIWMVEDKKGCKQIKLNIARCYKRIGLAHFYLKQYSSSINFTEKALSIQEIFLTSENFELAESYNVLAEAYKEQGDVPAATDYSKKFLAVYEKNPGDPSLMLNASARYNLLGLACLAQKNNAKAIENFKIALDIRAGQISPADIPIAQYYKNLGDAYKIQGESEDAMDCYRKALAIFEENKDSQSQEIKLEIADSNNKLGQLYFSRGDYPEAKKHFVTAVKIDLAQKKPLGIYHNDLGSAHRIDEPEGGGVY